MGWFSNPKCPRCGGETVATGYSFPYPQLRCNRCYNESKRLQELEDRIEYLEKKK